MSAESVPGQVAQPNDTKSNDKELNFARLRQERDRMAMALEQERAERERLTQENQRMKEATRPRQSDREDDQDDDHDEPYVDRKALKRNLARERESILKEAEQIASRKIAEENNRNFMTRLKAEHPDFDNVLNEETAAKLEQVNPKIAEMIMQIPDEYQRRKMAYETVKMAGLHKKPEAAPIQDKVNQNMRNPYYHPSSAGSGPVPMGDFSEAGKKSAYEKTREMMKRPLGAR